MGGWKRFVANMARRGWTLALVGATLFLFTHAGAHLDKPDSPCAACFAANFAHFSGGQIGEIGSPEPVSLPLPGWAQVVLLPARIEIRSVRAPPLLALAPLVLV